MLRTAVAGARILRSGNVVARVRVLRDATAAVRVSAAGAGVRTGVLDALARGARDGGALAREIGAADPRLLVPFLRMLAATGLVRAESGRWVLTRRGRAVLADPFVRAGVLAYSGYHTDLYRGLADQLAGGAPRSDVETEGETIAQLSIGFQPFVEETVRSATARARPDRVLDVGCGAGRLLAVMLESRPSAVGIGIDTDAAAVRLAEATLRSAGLAGRAQVLREDAAAMPARIGELGGPVDLLLVANVIYYVPLDERVAFLSDLASVLRPGGTLLLVTTVADDDRFSRHFDLLLRAQGSGMELPVPEQLRGQAVRAGLADVSVRRLAPGLPLIALTAVSGGVGR